MVLTKSDDEVGIKTFSKTQVDDELKEGMCNGILKILGVVDEGMGGCTDIGVIKIGTHVET